MKHDGLHDSKYDDAVKMLSGRRSGFGRLFYESIDESPGLYCFWTRNTCLYVGMSTNLKRRMKQHCEAETNPQLAEYFDVYNGEIEACVVYENVGEEILRRMESYAIQCLHPLANRMGAS